MNPEAAIEAAKEEAVAAPRRCRYVKHDICRDPMAGIDGCCLVCMAGKIIKARTQGARMGEFYRKIAKELHELRAKVHGKKAVGYKPQPERAP